MAARTILVTGGAGYIGAVMCEALREHGMQAVVLDNLSHGYRDAVPPGAVFVGGDVGDAAVVRELFARHAIDAVIHMAAYIEVGESMLAPRKYFDNNFARPLVLLEAMEGAGVRKFVLSSTAAVYGAPERVPIPEDAALRPLNPYGWSKLMLEQALAWHAAARGWRYAALRYFNAAGATERCGERHQPETHLIPLVLEAAAGEREAIAIFGSDYDTADGTCIRDYIHVRDLAEAHIVALRQLDEPASATADLAAHAWNIGNGQGFSVREVIAAAEKVCGRKIPTQLHPRRPGDPPALVASAAKLQAAGWRPRHTNLEEIIASAWHWKLRQPQGLAAGKPGSGKALSSPGA
ncbi:MAG TPA: UDP-glucose 4-epimerase GalE [Terriglobales bacterium]|nr:UDP-glucose 4-epimerase GalE [Terriglobales bacterium]